VDLVDYFDATYVTGSIRRIQRPVASHRIQPLRIRRTPPLFPPLLWNVHHVTLAGAHRTNNLCESWNCGFASLVGHHHPSLWTQRLLKLFGKMKHWRQRRSRRSLGDRSLGDNRSLGDRSLGDSRRSTEKSARHSMLQSRLM